MLLSLLLEKQALFVSFGMKKKKKKRRRREKDKKREAKKFFSELNPNFILLTCEHISSSNEKNIFNLLFEKLKHLFFARVFLCANIPTS